MDRSAREPATSTYGQFAVAGVAWDLSELYGGPGDPRARSRPRRGAARAPRRSPRATAARSTSPGGPAPEWVAAALRELESILEQADKPAVYAGLLHAADVAAAGARRAGGDDPGARQRDPQPAAVLRPRMDRARRRDGAARHRRAGLRRATATTCASLRRYRPHTLSEPEEKLLEETANTGRRAFHRLFDETLSAMTFDGRDRRRAADAQRERRPGAAARRRAATCASARPRALTDGLRAAVAAADLHLQHHRAGSRADRPPARAIRDPMASRHLANEIDARDGRRPDDRLRGATPTSSRRYYQLKRRLLGARRRSTTTTATRRSPARRDGRVVAGGARHRARRLRRLRARACATSRRASSPAAGSMPRCATASAAAPSAPAPCRACTRTSCSATSASRAT